MTESSQKCPTPRQRFVGAMRELYQGGTNFGALPDPQGRESVRQAAEAFADAECGDALLAEASWAKMHPDTLRRAGVHPHDHAVCRAALVKGVFGD